MKDRSVTAFRRVVSHGARKDSLRCVTLGPYRKPTQVGEMKILRRARELTLRNSAKCVRNFGRSTTSARGWHRNGPSDCLPKTQVSANS